MRKQQYKVLPFTLCIPSGISSGISNLIEPIMISCGASTQDTDDNTSGVIRSLIVSCHN